MTDVRGGAQLLVGLAGLGLAAAPTLQGRPPPPSELAWFRSVNRLPDALNRPVWLVMQLGALGAVPVVAGAAFVAGDRRLAGRLLTRGTTAWVGAKAVKRLSGRGRPGLLVDGTTTRGRAATGGGFPSGHAAVATAMAAAAWGGAPRRRWRVGLGALAGTVAVARMYVGAHLPLDVAGGAALGLAVDGAFRLLERDGQL